MPAEKRKRAVNFTTEEKMRFLRILQIRGLVIITKVNSHDLDTNRRKEDAWTEITDELNATGSIHRTKDTLKKLWNKLKTDVRSLSQTNGSGEGESRFDDPALEVVADIMSYGSSSGDSTCSGLESVYDESQILYIKQERNPARKRRHSETNVTSEMQEETQRTSSNYRFETERLRGEIEKNKLIDLQKAHMIQEHELRVKQAELKTKILESVLQKVQDGKPVDPELLKLVSTIK